MGKFLGKAGTDAYGVVGEFVHTVRLRYTKEQMAAADDEGILEAYTLITTKKVFTEFDGEMPYARNVTIVATGATTKKAIVKGYDIGGVYIEEELTLNGTTPVSSELIFAKVTELVLPIKTGSEKVKVGWGDLVGLPYKLEENPLCDVYVDGTLDNAPTIVADADVLAKNSIAFNTAPAGDEVMIDLRIV